MKGFELFKPNVEKMRAKKDIDGLIKALMYGIGSEKGKGTEVRLEAVKALGLLGDKRAIGPLSQLIRDENHSGEILIEGVKALIALDPDSAIEPIRHVFTRNWTSTKKELLDVLEKLGDERFVEPLILALHDSNNVIRTYAIRALGKIGGERAIAQLFQMAMEGVGWDASDALAALSGLFKASPVSLETTAVVQRLRDRSARSRSNAANLLRTVGWTPNNEEERADYLIACGGFEEVARMGESGVERLVTILKDPHENDEVRMQVAGALGGVQSERAVAALIYALADGNGGVRNHAAKSLGLTGDKKAVDPLIKALKHPEGGISSSRVFAAEALGVLGDERAIGPLREASATGDKWLREAADEALRKIGGPRAMETIGLSKRTGAPSIESLTSSVFQWSGNDFVGPNKTWVDKVRQENSSAISWFDAQGFVPIPTFAGEEGAAEHCFDMASQAQNSGNTQEAWAGFHQALRRFARLQNERMLGLTCFNLGKVYGVRQDWEMARLMFLQSAYLANKAGKEDGYAWALFYLGDTSDKLGDKDLAIQFLSEALPVFQRVSPNDIPGVQAALRRLTGGKQENKQSATMRSCPECGNLISDNAVRCHKCGHRFG